MIPTQHVVEAKASIASAVLANGAHGTPKLFFVPDMHAGLVTDVDGRSDALEEFGGSADDGVLGRPTEVSIVVVRDVIVLDAVPRASSFYVIPNVLEHSAGREPPLRQPQFGKPIKYRGAHRIRQHGSPHHLFLPSTAGTHPALTRTGC